MPAVNSAEANSEGEATPGEAGPAPRNQTAGQARGCGARTRQPERAEAAAEEIPEPLQPKRKARGSLLLRRARPVAAARNPHVDAADPPGGSCINRTRLEVEKTTATARTQSPDRGDIRS